VTLNLKSLKKISEVEAGLSPTSAAAEMTAGTTDQEHYDADGAGKSPPSSIWLSLVVVLGAFLSRPAL
jgi:hypothetical protein